MMTDYVYINYSRSDKQFAVRLAENLMDRGIKIWIDIWNIKAGEAWRSQIEEAINNASAIISVLSPRSVLSAGFIAVMDQVTIAGARIIPVLAEQTYISPFLNVRKQKIDFTEDFNQGLEKLLVALDNIPRAEGLITPGKTRTKGYVFISYAEEDSSFVDKLKGFFGDRDYAYWDFRESDRDYQVQLSLELEEIILNSEATISILSPDWKRSEWAMKEFLFSEEVAKPVFLLLARKMEPTLLIAGRIKIDFSQDIEKGFFELGKALTRKGL